MQWLDLGPTKKVTKRKKIASKTIALLKQLIEESLTINQSNYQPTLCKVDFLSVFLFVPSKRIWIACCSTLIRSHLSRFAEGQRHPKWTVMRHPVNQGDFFFTNFENISSWGGSGLMHRAPRVYYLRRRRKTNCNSAEELLRWGISILVWCANCIRHGLLGSKHKIASLWIIKVGSYPMGDIQGNFF